MAINSLSLPVDIPWKRLCVSEDMIDKRVCDHAVPPQWRSSIAVFSYEPPEDYQNHEGMVVSYLKVVCTITGYSPGFGFEEVGLSGSWEDFNIYDEFQSAPFGYYGCHGAILEVHVGPVNENEDTPASQYPYFAAFEPKKRELYELVSETGESLSRSLEDVSVGKGETTTLNNEYHDMNLGGGGSYGSSLNIGGMGGSANQAGNVSMQKGTRNMTGLEHTDIRTTDRAREIRESYSHTTQLTQMYHQLLSYHLGTNRAIFVLNPRPHIVQSEKTFVSGPRLLEGIQEFFLVVMRPKEMKNICVEAYLETAHLDVREREETAETRLLPVETFTLTSEGESFAEKEREHTYWVEDSQTFPSEGLSEGWEIDHYELGPISSDEVEDVGYFLDHRQIGNEAVEISARLRWAYDTFGKNQFYHSNLTVPVYITVRKKVPEVSEYLHTMYVTGRGLCCCPDAGPSMDAGPPMMNKESVNWEGFLQTPTIGPVDKNVEIPIKQANQLGKEIGQQLLRSVNHPSRYKRGTVSFFETQCFANRIARFLQRDEHPDNQAIEDIQGIDPIIREKVIKIAPQVKRRWLLKARLPELMDRFGLTHDEVIELRRAALGLSGPMPDPKDRWDPARKRKKQELVPNVVGLSLGNARKALRVVRFALGNITFHDDKMPRGTVLSQNPESGTKALSPSTVDLELASGEIVQIPDIVGIPLSEAICALREVGLESEPEISFTTDVEMPKGHVLDVKPGMRSFVTPHASVVLVVAKEAPEQSGGKK